MAPPVWSRSYDEIVAARVTEPSGAGRFPGRLQQRQGRCRASWEFQCQNGKIDACAANGFPRGLDGSREEADTVARLALWIIESCFFRSDGRACGPKSRLDLRVCTCNLAAYEAKTSLGDKEVFAAGRWKMTPAFAGSEVRDGPERAWKGDKEGKE
ncbi:hypothetical protein P7K49_028749 [Saguinus oedipus]|uniref:Uncharacterized protein n=1 Tax=Saguinus oedipus TaxID=9490 RepID=A0ABQ9U589_SAGOE|nr:hypothetical protein P7K49_028749 [Saguinus oedipus]